MKTTFKLLSVAMLIMVSFLMACDEIAPNNSDDPRDQYIGEWRLTESSQLKSTKAQSYLINIVKDESNSSRVIIQNMGNPGSTDITATAIVTTSQLVITSQQMSNGWTVEGAAKITNVVGTASEWNYSITAGGDKETYTAIGSKQ